jgi:WD40 repeat protein/serine/threonine protein kinase
MAASLSDNEVIFHAARDIPDPRHRQAYVREACGGDEAWIAYIDELLVAANSPDSLLDRPVETEPETPVGGGCAERAGTVIGPYKLLQQIGEGGMGIVWMAEQTQPVQRKVALKVIKPGMDSRQVIARFEAERQALAMMDHVNIARVFDGGTTRVRGPESGVRGQGSGVRDRERAGASVTPDSCLLTPGYGRPYFVMELVHGVPITKYCDDNHLTPRERLELFVPVCQAIQHAHQKGIIHRDIKPSNVMVTLYDGKPVPKVIDFGVAKATEHKLTERTLFTQYGTMVGTLEYMSPEQAEMSALGVDTRSDIYSLGVLLYELLTGSTPLTHKQLKEAAYPEILRMIKEEEPPRPSTRLNDSAQTLACISAQRKTEPAKLTRMVRGELDWIVMKCLEKDRNRRYEAAGALAADVQRYLNDEPVHACPPSAWYRFTKFARRKKGLLLTASALAVALLMAVATLAVSGVLVWRANQDLEQTLYLHRIALAHRELSADNLHGALKFLEECPENLRDWEWHYLMRLCRFEPLVLRDTTEVTEVNGAAFSADGERIASACGDGAVKIWNSTTGVVVQSFPAHAGAVVSVVFHPDGRHLASRGADLKVKVWDLTATGQAVFTESCDATRKFGTAYTVAFSADGRQLAAGTDNVVKVWDWKNRQLLHTLPGHNFHSIPVAFSGDGRLATGAFREPLRIWDPATGRLLRTVPAHRHPIGALAFSPDGKRLASASFDRTVKLSNSTTGAVLHTFDLHTGNVECVAFSRNGRRLASGGEDKTVRLWDATTGREVLGLHGHTDRCGCVAFSPDGRRLASASADGTIRIWDGTPLRGDERGQETLTFAEHNDEIRSVAFNPASRPVAEEGPEKGEGAWVASAGHEGTVKIWDAQSGRSRAEFSGHEALSGLRGLIFCVAWHPKGQRIASAGIDTVRVWEARTQREVFKLPAAVGKIALPYQSVAFSADGRYLVTGKVDGSMQVWDAGSGQKVGTLAAHSREIRGVVFSKDGKHLATASSDGIVKLWDAQRLDKQHLDGKPEPRIPPIRARVAGPGLNVAFSPDGRRLVTGGEANTVKIWDVGTGQELQTLHGHSREVYTVTFSPDADGRWIASAGEDSTVKVWDSRTGALVRSFRGHTSVVSSLAFSPDGRLLVSGSRDHTVKVWDVTQLDEGR